ncbi:hypothetical protein FGO68_gene16808 [Halteria grandinella]|uniref:Lysozyme n=1 Tax=Halteria grandinella TaxID=5974 RepID=A0A8J8NIN7_HALGN|nr:hypothetical protein FGO68_gene16808 [Halteria grandinella]
MVEYITPDFDDFVSLIKHFEGYSATPYICPGGVKTIGYGHTGKDVIDGMEITEEQGEQLLIEDLKEHQGYVDSFFKSIPLKENQIGALVSFCFNLGPGNLGKSSLKRRLLAGEDPNTVAREEIPKWNKAAGQVLRGLVRRRKAEVDFFCK